MTDVSSLMLVRELYEYHWWANRRLFEAASALGEKATIREMGAQFSEPTVKALFVHVYGFDVVWLARWRGSPQNRLPRDTDFSSMAELGMSWDALQMVQRNFIDTLTTPDLGRVVAYQSTEGQSFRLALWPLLQHVANLATHHRSETATRMTMLNGNSSPCPIPPDHSLNTIDFAAPAGAEACECVIGPTY